MGWQYGLYAFVAAIIGGIAAANHINTLAEAYGVSVILHTDHAAKKLLPRPCRHEGLDPRREYSPDEVDRPPSQVKR
jgi:fructose/tagatose bisphosphate aldolase